MRVLVTGAGGFIGHHLVTYLKSRGYWVRGVDLNYPKFAHVNSDEFHIRDLREWEQCLAAMDGIEEVYALAADMGGIGFISSNHASILHNNALVNLHTIEAAHIRNVKRYLYTSSACIYPTYRQSETDITPLKEEDAYPASPEGGYGWEKLISERLCEYYTEQYGMQTRCVRLHNIYGPFDTYRGGREKAPAALCRKVAETEDGGEIEVWGDGEQTRSFCHIDDCVEGIYRTMQSDYRYPLNLGSEHIVTINDLTSLIIEVSGKKDLSVRHIPGPEGVRGRNSDNARLREALGWEPQISLEAGIAETYSWVAQRVAEEMRG